jgi:hypothetical protein
MRIPLTASLFWYFLILFLVFAIVLAMRARNDFPASVLFALGLGIASFPTLALLFVWSATGSRSVVRTVFGTFLVFYTACGLSLLKGMNLLVYAAVELAFAILMAAQTMRNLTDEIEPLQSLSIIAAMYLFVRGLDDVNKYFADRKGKPPKQLGDYLNVLRIEKTS